MKRMKTLLRTDNFARALLALVAARWLMVLLLVLEIPPLEGHVPPWYFHTGGDQHNFYNLARAVASGHGSNELVGLGPALAMTPPIWLLDAGVLKVTRPWDPYRDILGPIFILNGFILGGASVALAGLIGKVYTGDRRVGLLGAALWLLLPVFVYLAVGLHPSAFQLRGSLLPKIMWLTGVSDGPASFGILLGVWALGRALERGSPRAFFVAGLGLGVAVLYRIQVAPVVAFLLGLLLLMRAWSGLLLVCAGGLLGYLPQAIFNTVQFGFPFYTGYLRNVWTGESVRRSIPEIIASLPYSPSGLVQSLTYFVHRYPLLAVLLAVGGACGVMLAIILWRRRGWRYAAILFGVPTVHVVANVSVYFFRDDPVRHSMLAYPYIVVIGAYVLVLASTAFRRATGQSAS